MGRVPDQQLAERGAHSKVYYHRLPGRSRRHGRLRLRDEHDWIDEQGARVPRGPVPAPHGPLGHEGACIQRRHVRPVLANRLHLARNPHIWPSRQS